MQQRRRGVPGAGAVGFGAALLGLSLILAWFPDRTGWEAFSGVDALVFLLALVCLGLLVFASSRHTLVPFLYTRILGMCALVSVVYGVVRVETGITGGRLGVGVLIAGLGVAMIIGGSAAALDRGEQTQARPGPR